MHFHITLSIVFFSVVFGHIELESLGPFRGRSKPNTKNIDYDDTTGEGMPTTIWKHGAPAFLKLTKGGLYSGRSCQASLIYDSGKSCTVIYSMQGNCPASDMAFAAPADAPLGVAIGSSSWFNKSGNGEMCQNCFSVTTESANGGITPAIPFAQRPAMLVVYFGTSYKTVEMTDVQTQDLISSGRAMSTLS
ncbi:hypothetical protein VTL71DRAFT_5974 [Oculimacula yallundae]|uniref:Uncharacterized protein n=1 Tax=Oculimacula yallundae TaxID=86028 RepID=A0ABR4BZ46_9HELO